MAVPFLAGLAKGLLSQGAKKAATSALKNAAKDKSKVKQKNLLKIEERKVRTKKNHLLVEEVKKVALL